MKTLSIDRALTDKRLLGAALEDVSTWTMWLVVLKAAFALGLDRAELELFCRSCWGSSVADATRA